MPEVDLSSAELQARVAKRVIYLHDTTQDLVAGPLDNGEVFIRVDELWRVAEGYFLLSEAFKAVRLKPGRRTEPAKIAAMMAMAVMTFRPMRPGNPDDVRFPETDKANQLLAVAIGCEVLGISIDWLLLDQLKRLLRAMDLADAPSLAEYVADARLDNIKTVYDVPIEQDFARIDNFTLLFELLQQGTPVHGLVAMLKSWWAGDGRRPA